MDYPFGLASFFSNMEAASGAYAASGLSGSSPLPTNWGASIIPCGIWAEGYPHQRIRSASGQMLLRSWYPDLKTIPHVLCLSLHVLFWNLRCRLAVCEEVGSSIFAKEKKLFILSID